MANRRYSYWKYTKRLKVRCRKLFGSSCQSCGATSRLHYAHVAPTSVNGKGRGLKRRYLDILKHPECYRRLCSLCHGSLDSGELSVDEIDRYTSGEVGGGGRRAGSW